MSVVLCGVRVTDCLVTTPSAREFKAGEQLFENYGQPNHIYFTYHGFLLQVRAHTVCIIRQFASTGIVRCPYSLRAAWLR